MDICTITCLSVGVHQTKKEERSLAKDILQAIVVRGCLGHRLDFSLRLLYLLLRHLRPWLHRLMVLWCVGYLAMVEG